MRIYPVKGDPAPTRVRYNAEVHIEFLRIGNGEAVIRFKSKAFGKWSAPETMTMGEGQTFNAPLTIDMNLMPGGVVVE